MKNLIGAALLVLATLAAPAMAADHQIKMLNVGADGGRMVFEPAWVKVAVGDTVTFVATDKGHNAETIKGMAPEGSEPFKGSMAKDITVTFTEPGVYGVKCLPHFGMGMVALVLVGDAPYANLEDAKGLKVPPGAKKVFDKLFTAAGI